MKGTARKRDRFRIDSGIIFCPDDDDDNDFEKEE